MGKKYYPINCHHEIGWRVAFNPEAQHWDIQIYSIDHDWAYFGGKFFANSEECAQSQLDTLAKIYDCEEIPE